MQRLYFDYNATTPLRPEALELMMEVYKDIGNPSSVHYWGRLARKHIEHARKILAKAVNTDPSQVVFNSGASEANNTILKHFDEKDIWTSRAEHSSVRNVIPNAPRIPVTEDGIVDLNALEEMLEKGPLPKLISVIFVNSETGAINPVAEIAKLAKKYDVLVHSDAVQALGRIEIDMKAMNLDYLSVSAHKIGGPQGVGALIMGACAPETPRLIHGGTQENHRRSGTENAAGVAGFGKGLEMALAGREDYVERLGKMRDTLQASMLEIVPEMKVMSGDAPRAPNTLNISWPGQQASMLLMNFDLEGVAVSTGSACSSGSMKPSPMLKAMGVSDEEALGALRISMGWNTKPEEVDEFLVRWKKIVSRVRA
ncbi:MAG: cysteine desulfurase [Micavibrio sp.]|nr:cysteine desulfurase [Micavibrio sp.]|tara:strand:- start:3017 stop:4123 length:1107 start_codon:yes stop_codon:yes gene_type:complete